MKILVAGGAGFIGSHVVDSYVSDGHETVVVDSLASGNRDNLNMTATFCEVDLCDQTALEDVFVREQPDYVNHHAAQVDVRRAVEDPSYDAHQNVMGTINLLECCRKYSVQKIIYVSSGGAVYGEPISFPVTESHPICPLSPYGLSKYIGEQYVELYNRLHGLDYTILRYPNVYGPRQDPKGEAGVVAIFTQLLRAQKQPTIFGDGTKTRDYLFVKDIVRANQLVTGDAGGCEIFNLGWSKEVTDQQVFEAVRDALAAKVEPIYSGRRPGEIERICLDASKVERELRWRPEVFFLDGVKRTVESGEG